ncbi:MAG: P-loop NTPase [Planctomycetes bacterium]|nr:P-loop NTPase [Planctomycetota bacterium]MCB9869828.1 P-loop NTPase [Planctomycetota bacterium]
MTESRKTLAQVAKQLDIGEEQVLAAIRLASSGPVGTAPAISTPMLEELMRAVRTETDRHGLPGGARIFGVTSGKGGVGKTSLTVNLATELAAAGHRTLLVDLDLGLSNAHILAGLKPQQTLSDYLDGTAKLADLIVDGPHGVKLIAGGSGIQEMANLDDRGRLEIIGAISELRPFCDVILLDTGAGVSSSVTDFLAVCDHTIVVTTSNFAAIADAYGIIKIVCQEGYDKPIHVVVNRVKSPTEGEQVYAKLKGCTERFLSLNLNWLGLLPEDHSVEGAVLQRLPFCEAFPASTVTRYLKKIVSTLESYLPALHARTS